jgi:hypothetical protein
MGDHAVVAGGVVEFCPICTVHGLESKLLDVSEKRRELS